MMRRGTKSVLIVAIFALGGCTEANPASNTPADGGIEAGGSGCTSDKQCSANKQVCDLLFKKCVDCLFDLHCSSSQHCVNKKCVGYTSCKNSLDCKNVKGKPICSKILGECVPCEANTDCGKNQDCIKNTCVPYTPCKNSKECPNQVCNMKSGKCVDCLSKTDCGKDQDCVANKCKTYYPCQSDKDCTDKSMLCDKAKGRCAQCLQHADCPSMYNCQAGICVLDECAQSQSKCVNNGVAKCNKVGDGYDAPKSCGKLRCVQSGSTAKCEPGVQDGPRPDAGAPDLPRPEAGPPDATPPDQGSPKDSGLTGKWVTIPAGKFWMGSPTSEPCRKADETQHQVTLTRKFEIQATEVTQAQFSSLMGYNPSHFSKCGSTCPVDYVSWHEAAAYANALAAKAGKAACYACTGSGTSVSCSEATAYAGAKIYSCPGYRLPTEAEWEFVYRAGTNTAFYNGGITACSGKDLNMDKIGWYLENSAVTYPGCSRTAGKCLGPHAVGQKTANAWGLYDMAGNVWEFCHDRYESYPSSSVTDPVGISGSHRAIRGGCWISSTLDCRAAYRGQGNGNRSTVIGFRLVRSLVP